LKKTILQIYALLSCFIALIIFMFTISFTIGYLFDLQFTETRLGSSLIPYKSNERFLRLQESKHEKHGPESKSKKYNDFSNLSEKELTTRRQEARNDLIMEKKLDAKAGLFSSLSWLLIGVVIFLIHWRLYNSIKE